MWLGVMGLVLIRAVSDLSAKHDITAPSSLRVHTNCSFVLKPSEWISVVFFVFWEEHSLC